VLEKSIHQCIVAIDLSQSDVFQFNRPEQRNGSGKCDRRAFRSGRTALVLGDYGFSLGVLYRGDWASRGHNAPAAATLAEIERKFVLEVVPARQHP
jgi:hypothetical protein